MCFLGQATKGVYVDDFKGVDPSVLEYYYGVAGNPAIRGPNQTGAGYPSDEESDDEHPQSSEDDDMSMDDEESHPSEDEEMNAEGSQSSDDEDMDGMHFASHLGPQL
jgi:hypothetical protein